MLKAVKNIYEKYLLKFMLEKLKNRPILSMLAVIYLVAIAVVAIQKYTEIDLGVLEYLSYWILILGALLFSFTMVALVIYLQHKVLNEALKTKKSKKEAENDFGYTLLLLAVAGLIVSLIKKNTNYIILSIIFLGVGLLMLKTKK